MDGYRILEWSISYLLWQLFFWYKKFIKSLKYVGQENFDEFTGGVGHTFSFIGRSDGTIDTDDLSSFNGPALTQEQINENEVTYLGFGNDLIPEYKFGIKNYIFNSKTYWIRY